MKTKLARNAGYVLLLGATLSASVSSTRSLCRSDAGAFACEVLAEHIREGKVDAGCLASAGTEASLVALNPRFSGFRSKMAGPVAAFAAKQERGTSQSSSLPSSEDSPSALSRKAYAALQSGLQATVSRSEKFDFYFTGAFTLALPDASRFGAAAAVHGADVMEGMDALLMQCRKNTLF
jgi:hypothetical protein